MKIAKVFIAALITVLAIPFASAFADEPISITTLEQLTNTNGQAGNYRLDADIVLTAGFTMRDGFVLDLNSHTLNAGAQLIKISGHVTVKDLSSNQAGMITGSRTYVFYVYGDRILDLESGTLRATNGYVAANAAATDSKAAGIINVKGGTIVSTTSLAIVNGGITNVTGGTVKSLSNNSVAIQNSDTGELYISGGRVEAVNATVLNNSKKMTISGGTIYSEKNDGVTGNTNSELIMTGGTIQTDTSDHSGVRLAMPGGKFTMTGGTIIATKASASDPNDGGAGVTLFKDTELL